ncbi:hypothetical protein RUM44_004207 [Polyplax serrata]|uniref:Uncharacterized protein n=1 Tax=Polyplax serrata TaxID=468196 RepID=A0ABR1B274_POLSC
MPCSSGHETKLKLKSERETLEEDLIKRELILENGGRLGMLGPSVCQLENVKREVTKREGKKKVKERGLFVEIVRGKESLNELERAVRDVGKVKGKCT